MTKVFIPFKHNSIFNEIEKHFQVTTLVDCDAVLLWNDVNPLERGIIQLAKSKGKKTFVIQHGRKGSSRYFPPFNEKIQADKLLVWGDFDRRSLIEVGQDPARIGVVGTTVLHGLPDRRGHAGVNIVFCPEHWDQEVPENQKVKEELRKLKDVKIITKVIESHDPQNYDNPVVSRRSDPSHLTTCAEVLSTADLVVGISESTFELMAQAMDIPVVIMEEWEPKAFGGDERYFTYRRVISEGSKKAKLENLNEIIMDQLKNQYELRAARARVTWDEGSLGLDTIKLIEKEINA